MDSRRTKLTAELLRLDAALRDASDALAQALTSDLSTYVVKERFRKLETARRDLSIVVSQIAAGADSTGPAD